MAKKLSLLLLPLLLGLASDTLWGWHWFEPAARRNQKGIAAYRQEKYAAALEQFLSAKGLKPDAQPLKNNTAAALYQLKKFQEAADEFSSIDPARLGRDQAGLHYNLGNTQYRLGQFPKALESYKRSLLLAPDDVQCKKNFELTLKKIREQQPQQQQPDNQAQAEQQKQKYEAMMQFLNQNEKQQMEKKKRKAEPARNEKDW